MGEKDILPHQWINWSLVGYIPAPSLVLFLFPEWRNLWAFWVSIFSNGSKEPVKI